jgi:hypothetical protein
MASSKTKQRRARIQREEPLHFWKFPADERTLWFAASFLVGLGGFFAAVATDTSLVSVVLGMAWLIGCLVCWVFFVGLKLHQRFTLSGLAVIYLTVLAWKRDRRRENVYSSEQPDLGEVYDFDGNPQELEKRKKKDYIRPLGRLEFKALELPGGNNLGVLHDKKYAIHAGSLECKYSSHLSVDEEDQDRFNQGFAGLLASMAAVNSPIHRFAWRVQTFPGEYVDPDELFKLIREGAGLTRLDTPNRQSVWNAMMEMSDMSVVHRTTMTLALYNNRVLREARAAGGTEYVLKQALRDFRVAALGTATGFSPIGLQTANFHSYNDLVMETRLALDPFYMWPRMNGSVPLPADNQYLDPRLALPGNADYTVSPTDFVMGDTFHRGFYFRLITGRSGMPPGELWKILKVRVPKTVTVIFQLVPARRGELEAQWHASAAGESEEDRQTRSRRRTAVSRDAERLALEHEEETVENRVGRVSVYIDLTAPASVNSSAELDVSQRLMSAAWDEASFEVQPMNGAVRQNKLAGAVLPACRGLASIPRPRGL